MSGFKCPKCGGETSFDTKICKEVCKDCKAIWSYKIKDGKMTWWEWKMIDLKQNSNP